MSVYFPFAIIYKYNKSKELEQQLFFPWVTACTDNMYISLEKFIQTFRYPQQHGVQDRNENTYCTLVPDETKMLILSSILSKRS